MRSLRASGWASAAAVLALGAAALLGYPRSAASQGNSATTATEVSVSARVGQEYVVQRGDTLGRIAAKYGVTVQDLMLANDIENANLIYVGQVLVIPAAAGTAVSPTTAVTGTGASPTTQATVMGRPTATRTLTPTATPTLRPIQASRTAAARTRTPRPTATPTLSPSSRACTETLGQIMGKLQARVLDSGASILVPEEWTAQEVTGMSGPLPYLSDKRMSALIYLVGAGTGSVDDRLDLVPTLLGVSGATELVRQTEGDRGVAVWDARMGTGHRLVAGYVTPRYTAVFAGSTAFCSSTSAHSEAEAQDVAQLLQTVADSYRQGTD